MLVSIVQIGNSQGIRIPKSILEQCHIENKVNMEIKDNTIIITPIKKTPRKGWADKFEQMNINEDDTLLIDDSLDVNTNDWEW